MTAPPTIRPMTAEDWPAVEAIYRDGIATGNATFDPQPPTWAQFDSSKLAVGRLVAAQEDVVVGWIAASPVSSREVYRGVVEHSVYITPTSAGRSIGTRLLGAFIEAAEAADIWTIQASVFPENAASLALHKRAGFRQVGVRERIALMQHGPWAGHWRDTILIERRTRPNSRGR